MTADGPVTVTEWAVRYEWPDGFRTTIPAVSEDHALSYVDPPPDWSRDPVHAGAVVTAVSRTVTVTAWETDPASLFPVPGDRVKCGLRTDLPKKERVHRYVSLGPDTRNCGSAGFLEREILACTECGTDKAKAVAA